MKEHYSVLLYTHASSQIGGGHLNRCIILGEALRRRGHVVSLLCNADSLVDEFAKSIDWVTQIADPAQITWPEVDVCIVDRYCYDDSFFVELRRHIDLIAIFDDVRFCVPADVAAVINTNLYADISDYPHGIKAFVGGHYALLREDFRRQNARRSYTGRALVCLGASDPERQMERVLSSIILSTQRRIIAVYGPGFEDLALIERWRNFPNIETHHAPNDYCSILAGVDFVVCGAGSMLYEVASLGLPAIAIGLADNQDLLGKAFHKSGGCIYLGMHDQVTDYQITLAIISLDRDEERLNLMRQSQLSLCDGVGANRLALDLESWLKKRKRHDVSPFSRSDVEAEYNESASKNNEFEQVRWGSAVAMANRHMHIIQQLPFGSAKRWLDVGSGTGALQSRVIEQFPSIAGVGLELSEGLVRSALARKIPRIRFEQQDFLDHEENGYDLLTCIGVLAKSNMGLTAFFKKAAVSVQSGGHILIELKNRDWKRFETPGFHPEIRHLWFTTTEIVKAATTDNAFDLRSIYGFMPDEGCVVEPNDSHTLFLHATRT
jgi:UDP-2,4-diacetamido-2,4,6-trideoxy-beta-L-altropyranose hydrolase